MENSKEIQSKVWTLSSFLDLCSIKAMMKQLNSTDCVINLTLATNMQRESSTRSQEESRPYFKSPCLLSTIKVGWESRLANTRLTCICKECMDAMMSMRIVIKLALMLSLMSSKFRSKMCSRLLTTNQRTSKMILTVQYWLVGTSIHSSRETPNLDK